MLRYPARRAASGPSRRDPARRRRDQARHHPEQARFAGAARADQAHPLPGGHPQVDPVQHRQAPAFGRQAHSLEEDAGGWCRGGPGDPLRDGEAAEPGQHGPAGGARVEVGRQPTHREEHLGDEDQHRERLREDPLASVETQAEPDGHQGGADGGQEFEDQPGEQRDPQGGQRGRADLFARGGHGPLVVGGPAEGPEQRQALHQRVEAVAEALEAGQPAPDRGRGVHPDQPGQERRDAPGSRRPGRLRPGPGGRSRPAAGPERPGPGRSSAGPGPRRGRARRSRSRSAWSRRPVPGARRRGTSGHGRARGTREANGAHRVHGDGQRASAGRPPWFAGRRPPCRPPRPR